MEISMLVYEKNIGTLRVLWNPGE